MKYQLPSELYECHGHILMDGVDFAAARKRHRNEAGPSPDEAAVRQALAALQRAGIIYFRDGGDAENVSLLARKLAPEYAIEYVSPAFAIHKKGCYGSIVGRSFESIPGFRERIKEVRENGGDFIKIMLSGIITFRSYGNLSCEGLSKEEIRELVHISHEEGFAVMVHVNGDETILAAAEAGADSIEHGYFAGEETLACLAEREILWVPTLSAADAFAGRRGFDEGIARETLERQLNAVRNHPWTAAGSDSGAVGVPHGPGTVREYELLYRAGKTPESVLKANQRLQQIFRQKG